MDSLPLQLQTVYADLLQLHLSAPSSSVEGAIIRVEKGNRAYWVSRKRNGNRVSETALGPDDAKTKAAVDLAKAEQEHVKDFKRTASSYVKMLRAANLPAPDMQSGRLLAALAKTDFFRLGGVLGGTQAFRHYPAMLGVKAPNAGVFVTGDMDLMAPLGLKLAAKHPSLSRQLMDLGINLEPIFPLRPEDAPKWRVEGKLELEFLSPVGRGGTAANDHSGLGEKVQRLRFLEFSLNDPVPVVSLYREGALVSVPAPERFALHKLLVAALRSGSFAIKRDKDLAQAAWLIEVLSETRPYDLWSAWQDLLKLGKGWTKLVSVALEDRPDIAAMLKQVESEFE